MTCSVKSYKVTLCEGEEGGDFNWNDPTGEDHETKTRWGGTDHVSRKKYEFMFQTLFFQMARLVVQDCLVYIQCDDLTYTSGIEWNLIPESIEPNTFCKALKTYTIFGGFPLRRNVARCSHRAGK